MMMTGNAKGLGKKRSLSTEVSRWLFCCILPKGEPEVVLYIQSTS